MTNGCSTSSITVTARQKASATVDGYPQTSCSIQFNIFVSDYHTDVHMSIKYSGDSKIKKVLHMLIK